MVLNARNDAEEAAIVARGGRARRGHRVHADGGPRHRHPARRPARATAAEVVELGGLYVVGTGRYPSSRLDDQLRGRAGRQGDPGGSVIFASLDDDIVAQYAPEAAPGSDPDGDGLLEDAHARAATSTTRSGSPRA